MTIISRSEWGARHGRGRPTDPQEEVIWHHFYRPDVSAYASPEREREVMRQVEDYHARNLTPSNPRIGYLFVIFQSGRVYEGCGWQRIGAHTRGHNTRGCGIAHAVDGSAQTPTPEAIAAAQELVQEGIDNGHITERSASAHRDHGSTGCNGDNFYARISEFMEEPGSDAPKPPRDGGGDGERSGDYITVGDHGAEVRSWQRDLMRWNSSALPRYGADGIFGDETAEWTNRFYDAVVLSASDPSSPKVGALSRSEMEKALAAFSFRHSAQISRGDKGEDVYEWQTALTRLRPNDNDAHSPDGDFGPMTVRWTGRVMVDLGLVSSAPSNPIVGPRTRRASERALS